MRANREQSVFGFCKPLSLLLCSVVALTPANAALLSWNNAAGGAAATSGNWSPTQVPVAADDLVYNLNAVYPVTFHSSVVTSRMHVYRRGTVTLTVSNPHTVTAGVTIGDKNALTGTATLTTGTFTS